jgi:hypothetical protein
MLMLIRIVRMTFQPEKVAEFLAVFEKSKAQDSCHARLLPIGAFARHRPAQCIYDI